MTLYTVGHGTRSTDELAAVVRSAGVEVVADVRRFPGSRRNPHLSREALSSSLPGVGVGYEWWGESLGGRRSRPKDGMSRHTGWRVEAFAAYADWMDTEEFRSAFSELLASPRAVAVMCAETLWWRCHRRLLADAALARGVEVVHLLGEGEGQREPHRLPDFARIGDDGWPVYDGGQPGLLPDREG